MKLLGEVLYIDKGNVGIGTTIPNYTLHVEGPVYLNGPIQTNNNPINAGTASITAQTFIGTFSGGVSGTATNVSHFLTPGQYILGEPFDGSNAYTWDVKASSNFSSPETLVARDSTGRITASSLAIGSNTTSVSLEVNSTDAILLPKGTDIQRPSPAVQGYIRYNTTTSQFEGYGAGNSWGSLGGVKSTDQYTYITAELTPGTNDSNIRFYTSAVQQAIINPQGNLGIGTTSPTAKLHVQGNAFVSGTLTTSNLTVIGDFTTLNTVTSNTEQMVITNAGTGPALKVTQTGNNTVAEFYDAETGIALFIGNNGNIGIGTNNPTVALDVNGEIRTNNNNINAGTATITAQTFSGTATKVSSQHSPGQFLLGASFDGQSPITWDVKASSNYSSAETLVARDTTGRITASSLAIGSNTTSVALEVHSTNAILLPKGSDLQRPSPAVQGYIRYNTTTSQFEGYGAGNSWGSLGGVKSTDQYTYITAELTPGTNDSNIRFYTAAVQQAIINPSGNLGIGTATPTAKLHVEGNAYINGTLTTSNLTVIGDFTTLNTVTSNTEQMVITNAGTGPALKVTQTGNNTVAEFYDAETGIALFIGNNGNIGIGTNNPTVALDVNGQIRTNSNNIDAGTGTITAQTFSGTATQVSNTLTRGSYLTGNNYNGATATTWAVDATTTATASKIVARDASAYIYSSGVGIGTTTARQALDIQGGNAIVIGNVGIGTTVPRYNLHVEGTIYAPYMDTSNLTASNLTVSGELNFGPNSSTLKTNLQVNPVRKTMYVSTASSNQFYVETDGIYTAYTSNVQVFVNQVLQMSLTDTIQDYQVSSAYNASPPITTFTITLTKPAIYGDIIDIIVWPQLIQESAEEPKYVYQQVRVAEAHFQEVNATDIAYTLGNVGIGTTAPRAALEVNGAIIPSSCNVYDLGTPNLRFRDIYLSGNTIDLEGVGQLSTSNQDLVFRVNNIERLRIDKNGLISCDSIDTNIIHSPGSIVQIQHAQTTTTRWGIVAAANIAAIPELSISFTPKFANSKILLTAMINSTATHVATFGFLKNGSVIISNTNFNSTGSIATTYDGNAGTNVMNNVNIVYMDTATSTSTITYEAAACSSWNSDANNRIIYINDRSSSDMRSISSMTIYEIAV